MSETLKRIEINEADKSAIVRLRGARLSFPALFEPKSFDGNEAQARYSATFLIEKDSEDAKNMKEAIKAVIKMGLDGRNPGPERVCLRDGAVKDHLDGYGEGVYFIAASNSKRVPVVDLDLTQLSAEDGKPYAGCYVNATIRLWAQDNKYGKRVNANLRTVQFARDGEPFGTGGVDVDNEFSDVAKAPTSAKGSTSDDEDWL